MHKHDMKNKSCNSLTGAYLDYKPPRKMPELFTPGIISLTGSAEWSSCFSPVMNEFYFYRITKVADKVKIKIFSKKLVNGLWILKSSES